MRVVFAGTGAFAVNALQTLLATPDIALPAVISIPDRPRGRGRQVIPTPVAQAAGSLGVPVVKTERIGDMADALAALRPDLLIVVDFGQLVPEHVLRIPRIGPFNLHASLLPRWRGAAPVPNTILAGDRETGVTMFRMVRALDAGPILLASRTHVDDAETAGELEERLSRDAAALLLRALPGLASGAFALTPQDDALATLAPKLRKDEGRIRWKDDAAFIARHVRAMQPWPRAFTFLAEEGSPPQRVNILAALPDARPSAPAPPGAILATQAGVIEVASGRGTVRISCLQPAGKRAMSCAEFLRGHRFGPAACFLSTDPA